MKYRKINKNNISHIDYEFMEKCELKTIITPEKKSLFGKIKQSEETNTYIFYRNDMIFSHIGSRPYYSEEDFGDSIFKINGEFYHRPYIMEYYGYDSSFNKIFFDSDEELNKSLENYSNFYNKII
jgi:hypothetical protein